MDSATARLLHEDHRRTLATMNALEVRITGGAADRTFDRSNDDDRQLIESVIATIEYDIETHFRFEEDGLFPVLEARGVGEMTRMLVHEHDAIRPLAEHVRVLAQRALDQHLDPADWKEFRYAAMDLIPSVLFHIQKEEMSLLRQMSVLVNADVDADLARGYRDSSPAGPAGAAADPRSADNPIEDGD